MTLTEKWKKGELKQGEYWCKITESPYIERVYLPCCDDIIVEVLAPVPSYEEWDKMRKDFLHLKNIASGLLEGIYNTFKPEEIFIQKQINQENKQLRQLLKECKDIIEWYKADTGYVDLPTENVLTRINAAIGESEE